MPRINTDGHPEWDYEQYPSDQIRGDRCTAILIDLAARHLSLEAEGVETRPSHLRMFEGMTEAGEEYFAGHFRGENFPYLRDYRVGVGMDSRVGTPPDQVDSEMQAFAAGVNQVCGILDADAASSLLPNERLVRAVGMACALLVEFLRIHPYANGNGHIGRLIVWLALAKAGIWPRRWPLNDKVPMPYPLLLSEYRNGQRQPLMQFVLSHI